MLEASFESEREVDSENDYIDCKGVDWGRVFPSIDTTQLAPHSLL